MLEKGDIDQGTYDNITKKIDKTKEELSALEKQAEETASALKTTLSDFGNKMQGVGEKIEGVGKALMPLSAAAAGVATAGIKAASDWESAFAGVRKTVDATEEQYEELEFEVVCFANDDVIVASEYEGPPVKDNG